MWITERLTGDLSTGYPEELFEEFADYGNYPHIHSPYYYYYIYILLSIRRDDS